MMEQTEWEKLSPEQKKRQLYLKQKELLDTFLEHHAISKEQYEKSLGDLTIKMGFAGKTSSLSEYKNEEE